MSWQLGLKNWIAIAPGVSSPEQWRGWLTHPVLNLDGLDPELFKAIPPLLRRRLSTAGKLALTAMMQLNSEANTASLFASRHGDITVTYKLLRSIAEEQPMSPNNFSLAVHNAIGGLYTMYAQNTAPLSAIAVKKNLFLAALIEASAQIQERQQDLVCVIYDVPLPQFYQTTVAGPSFPFCVALHLGTHATQTLSLKQTLHEHPDSPKTEIEELAQFMALLVKSSPYTCQLQGKSEWLVTLN